jgi:hypothetical protein
LQLKIGIKRFSKQKEEVIQAKKDAWVNEWRYKNPEAVVVPNPPNKEVKAWFIGRWEAGFVVCDLEELMKLPKRQRDKILKLGGIQS